MSVIGQGKGLEYRKKDFSFFRGVVVENNDPLALNRVKVYIPDISNQPFDDWYESYSTFILRAPGTNCNPKTDKEKEIIGDWEDPKLFEEICNNIPWAEPCYPILGESSNFRYYKDGEISTISDCNYPEGFEIINTDSPTLSGGSYSPSYLFDNHDTAIGDAFNNPIGNFSVKCNPYSFLYKPKKNSNKAKGIFGVPDVGSKVWVFHFEGDYNFPIYFGVYRDYRELALINKTDNEFKIGYKYPSDFEN